MTARFLAAGLGVLLAGCTSTLSPVKNRISVGEEDFAVFAAESPGGGEDLFAVPSSGGAVAQVTFTPMYEGAPALSPNGDMVAFVRGRSAADTTSHRVWVMNLLNGAERELPAALSMGVPQRIGWSRDGRTIFVRTSHLSYRVAAPPAAPDPAPVTVADGLQADSALGVILGEPPFAEVIPCAAGKGICVRTRLGETQELDSLGREPVRWGADSIGYFVGTDFLVRPLAGGKSRRLLWRRAPAGIHALTFVQARPRTD